MEYVYLVAPRMLRVGPPKAQYVVLSRCGHGVSLPPHSAMQRSDPNELLGLRRRPIRSSQLAQQGAFIRKGLYGATTYGEECVGEEP